MNFVLFKSFYQCTKIKYENFFIKQCMFFYFGRKLFVSFISAITFLLFFSCFCHSIEIVKVFQKNNCIIRWLTEIRGYHLRVLLVGMFVKRSTHFFRRCATSIYCPCLMARYLQKQVRLLFYMVRHRKLILFVTCKIFTTNRQSNTSKRSKDFLKWFRVNMGIYNTGVVRELNYRLKL